MPLPAFNDNPLSIEAAEQLARMAADPNCPRHEGKDLPAVTEDELLAALKQRRTARWQRRLARLRAAMRRDVETLRKIIHGEGKQTPPNPKGFVRRLLDWLWMRF